MERNGTGNPSIMCTAWWTGYIINTNIVRKHLGGKELHLNTSRPDPGRREKNNLNFHFHTCLWCLKRPIKAFIKPFEAPQWSVKIKIYINFYFNTSFWNTRDGKGLAVWKCLTCPKPQTNNKEIAKKLW